MKSEKVLRQCFNPQRLDLALRMVNVQADKRAVHTLSMLINGILDKGGDFSILHASKIQAKINELYPEGWEEPKDQKQQEAEKEFEKFLETSQQRNKEAKDEVLPQP